MSRCPEKNPEKIAPRKITTPFLKYGPQENCPPENNHRKNAPPGKLTPEKLFYYIFVAFDIIIPLFFLKLFIVTNVTKSSCLDVAGVVDFPLSLLGEFFQSYLSVRHKVQLVKHGKTVKTAKSVSFKIIARKDIIFNKQFRAPQSIARF